MAPVTSCLSIPQLWPRLGNPVLPELHYPLEVSEESHHACAAGMCPKHLGRLWCSWHMFSVSILVPKCDATCNRFYLKRKHSLYII